MGEMSYDFVDSIGIFFANLSWYFMVSMVLSFLAIILTSCNFSQDKHKKLNEGDGFEEVVLSKHGLQSLYKLARQKVVIKKLDLQQCNAERETEAEQLAAILKLLQDRLNTFQLSTMDQLKTQLRLYRN